MWHQILPVLHETVRFRACYDDRQKRYCRETGGHVEIGSRRSSAMNEPVQKRVRTGVEHKPVQKRERFEYGYKADRVSGQDEEEERQNQRSPCVNPFVADVRTDN